MEKLFEANIHTPYKTVFQGRVSMINAPGKAGYFGILADHAPFISTLMPGKVAYRDAAGKVTIIDSKKDGFLEVLNNKVTVLLDSVEI